MSTRSHHTAQHQWNLAARPFLANSAEHRDAATTAITEYYHTLNQSSIPVIYYDSLQPANEDSRARANAIGINTADATPPGTPTGAPNTPPAGIASRELSPVPPTPRHTQVTAMIYHDITQKFKDMPCQPTLNLEHNVAIDTILMAHAATMEFPPTQTNGSMSSYVGPAVRTAERMLYAAAHANYHTQSHKLHQYWDESSDVLPRLYRAILAANLPSHPRR